MQVIFPVMAHDLRREKLYKSENYWRQMRCRIEGKYIKLKLKLWLTAPKGTTPVN